MSNLRRAAVLVEPEHLEIQEFPLPDIGRQDGLLKVEVAGMCGSDWGAIPRKKRRRPSGVSDHPLP